MENARSSNQSAGWIFFAVVLAGLLWALRGTFSAMAEIWLATSNFNHCLLIAPASALLIWRRRHRLAAIPTRGSAVGVLLFVGCAAVWAIGALGHVSTLQNLAVVAMLSAAAWAVLGYAVVAEIAFPLAYLFFMVPIGEFLMPWMMELTAQLTVIAARLSGVSVYQDGLFFTIPNGSFKIVEACSGMRMLIASVAVGVLFAHLVFASWIRRVVFVIAMVAVSMVANALRAYIVVMVGYLSGMETIASHVTLGYFVFGFVLLAMLIIGSRFADTEHGPPAIAAGPARSGAVRWWHSGASALLVGMITFATPAAVTAIEARAAKYPDAPPMLLPAAAGQWSAEQVARADWSVHFLGHDAMHSASYRRGPNRVDVRMVSYSRQQQGAELINARNQLFDPKHWTRIRETRGEIELGNGSGMSYSEIELRAGFGGGKRLVRYWYVVDGLVLNRPAEIKARELKNSLLGRPTPGTLVAISVRFGDDSSRASGALDAFTREVYARAYPPGEAID